VTFCELGNNHLISNSLLGRSTFQLTHLVKDFKLVSSACTALLLCAAVQVFLFVALQEAGRDEGTFKFVLMTVVLLRVGG